MDRFRRLPLPVIALIALLALSGPAFSADPSASGPPGQQNKAAKAPKVDVALRGTVEQSTDEQGRPTFTMTSGGTTWELSAGPKWFYVDDNPLEAYVGQTVDVTGSHREGATDVSVDTVNGTALRAAGKPAWAGGWKKVGEGHPGWSQEKADRHAAKFGDCFPPGQCKEKPAKPDAGATP
jgi:hypothetical protein